MPRKAGKDILRSKKMIRESSYLRVKNRNGITERENLCSNFQTASRIWQVETGSHSRLMFMTFNMGRIIIGSKRRHLFSYLLSEVKCEETTMTETGGG